ncbi:MAG: tetratricopeptide repeat protein [Steroidobacteraceae bacterium]
MSDASLFELERARILLSQGRWTDALNACDRALAQAPPTPELWVRRGRALFELRQSADSLIDFERALAAQPTLAAARIGRARALLRLGRLENALASIDELLTQDPQCPGARGVRAQILMMQGRVKDAWDIADEQTALNQTDPLTFFVRGLVLLDRAEPTGALTMLDRAIELNPVLAPAHLGKGRALAELNRTSEAFEAYGHAARLDPTSAEPYVRTGHLKILLSQFDGAVESFTKALERQPDHVAALQGRAQCLAALGRAPEALDAYSQLLAVAPNADYMMGERFHVQLHCCDWRDFEVNREQIAQRVRRGERADSPAPFLAHSDSPADQLTCARTFAADFLALSTRPLPPERRTAGKRIRVAYVSADFHAHATAFLAAGLFEQHDRSRFEILAVSFGPDDASGMRRRLEGAFDRFVDVRSVSDEGIAARMRELEIDIAVDVKGHTLGGRPRIFAHRPAPVQVSFLAYPGTVGVDFMDYIVADRHVIPERDRIHYAEQVIYLPDSYQANDSARTAAPRPTRREAGLPESAFVFCCFNSNYKLTPSTFAVWMEILQAVPNSVLWLLVGNPVAVQNLRRETAQRGVAAERLIFAPWQDAAQHLARCALADLFLDTLPCNAHTTASDALWAGVPLVTQAGATFVSRVATSLLHAVGLGHLSVNTRGDYARLAIDLAHQPRALDDLKAHLRRVRDTAPLFDTARYCRHLEAAYADIWARHTRGAPPSPLWVPRSA